jgi:carboxyl-terminal processing protease
MRGRKGTQVTIQVRRAEVEEPLTFSIVRDIIHVQSVMSKVLPGNIGYVRLRSFVESTSTDLRRALRDFEKKKTRGLILDLRNNPGGLLRQAVEVSDLFLGKGSLIVYTRGKRPEHNLKFLDRKVGPFGRTPMIILVNSGSASASEIVTGALQDLHRALVIGTRTFGKGSVQTIIPLSDGSGLRVTTALYYTPKGREIQEKGIPPDALVRQPGDKRNRDVVMERELRRNHEQKAKEQADSTAGEKVDSKTEEKPKSPPAEKKKVPSKPIILGSENDYQLSVARRILDEMPNRQVSNLMTRAREILNTPGPPQARAETPK